MVLSFLAWAILFHIIMQCNISPTPKEKLQLNVFESYTYVKNKNEARNK